MCMEIHGDTLSRCPTSQTLHREPLQVADMWWLRLTIAFGNTFPGEDRVSYLDLWMEINETLHGNND